MRSGPRETPAATPRTLAGVAAGLLGFLGAVVLAALSGGGVVSLIVNSRHKQREQERDQKHAKDMAALVAQLDDEASARKLLRELHLTKREAAAKDLGRCAADVMERLGAVARASSREAEDPTAAKRIALGVAEAVVNLDRGMTQHSGYVPKDVLKPFRELCDIAGRCETATRPVRDALRKHYPQRPAIRENAAWAALRDTWLAEAQASFDMDAVRAALRRCEDALRVLVGAHLVRELDAAPEPDAVPASNEEDALPAAAEPKQLGPVGG